MTPTDKLSEIDNPLERIEELTAERDRFGDRIDDLAAEVIRLRADVEARILFGAELIDSNARLRADLADRDKTIAELGAANALLAGLVEGARDVAGFYGDPTGWTQPPVKTRDGLFTVEYENQASMIQMDRGKRARKWLEEAK